MRIYTGTYSQKVFIFGPLFSFPVFFLLDLDVKIFQKCLSKAIFYYNQNIVRQTYWPFITGLYAFPTGSLTT